MMLLSRGCTVIDPYAYPYQALMGLCQMVPAAAIISTVVYYW
jgi:hypothetical protein